MVKVYCSTVQLMVGGVTWKDDVCQSPRPQYPHKKVWIC